MLAEREHIVGQALAVPVVATTDLDPSAQPSFGAAIRSKLIEAGASGERWTSWREPTGWVVKLEFTAREVDHDARWSFDPRRSTLSPQNADAVQLSRQGSLPDGLIPRLRALDHSTTKDESRFDSDAFGPRLLAEPDADIAQPDVPAPVSPAVQNAAIKRAPAIHETPAQTADLLEALRRRRGQREPMPAEEADEPTHVPVALFDALESVDTDDEAPAPEVATSAHDDAESPRRRGRTSMPSWDEIVFGARTEDG